MDDKGRDSLVLNSAYGYVFCLSSVIVVSIIFGKPYGRVLLFTLIPVYSIYYAIMYWRVCRSYEDEVMAQAESAGAVIVKPAQDTFWGGYAGYFQDLDGHLWEVVWNPQLLPDENA
ncbi:VOC family protein [Nitrincola alkalilacustris]|uniref:VOC family protein n=1 Tax=Nitrincola alkalilacustris TaxID=1571224 RepID=UPI00198150FD|nr:VOC family protein [Nitrincola alkalilacustris]